MSFARRGGGRLLLLVVRFLYLQVRAVLCRVLCTIPEEREGLSIVVISVGGVVIYLFSLSFIFAFLFLHIWSETQRINYLPVIYCICASEVDLYLPPA